MFIENLLKILEERKIKQNEICKKVNIPKTSINNWKNGSQPALDKVVKIAKELDVTIDYLVYGKEKQHKSELDMLYEKASEEDKQIVNLALAKYKEMGKSSNTKIG